MAHELFGDVVKRPSEARAPRRSLLAISVCGHVLVIGALIVASALAPEGLPVPVRALAFVEPMPIFPVDIALPAQPRPHVPESQVQPPSPALSSRPPVGPELLPPVVAPNGVGQERSGVTTGLPYAGPPVTTGVDGGVAFGTESIEVEPPPVRGPVRLHSGMRPPTKIVDLPPEYPFAARRSGTQGVVILELIIDAAGNVDAAKVLRPVHPLLDRAALDAVRAWRFTPALLNDVAVPVVMTVTVNFTLQR